MLIESSCADHTFLCRATLKDGSMTSAVICYSRSHLLFPASPYNPTNKVNTTLCLFSSVRTWSDDWVLACLRTVYHKPLIRPFIVPGTWKIQPFLWYVVALLSPLRSKPKLIISCFRYSIQHDHVWNAASYYTQWSTTTCEQTEPAELIDSLVKGFLSGELGSSHFHVHTYSCWRWHNDC